MTALGDLGVAREAPEPVEDIAFGWFGAEIRVNPYFEQLALVEFAAAINGAESGPILQRLACIKAALVPLLHSEDFTTFWQLALSNHQTVEDLAAVAFKLVEAVSARPTVRQPSSSDGLPSTGPSSAPVATSREVQAQQLLVAQNRSDLAAMFAQELPESD